jgi:two-component system, NarL family, nitrate/nitrite response regulator NarL
MSTPLVVTHPCALVRDGLHQIFTKSQFRPIQILPALTEEAESYLASAGICIWLVGVQQPGPAINEAIRRVVTANPHARVVLLAASYSPEDIVPALESGAGGFLCQDIPSNQLIKSLELIVLGQTVTHPQFHQIAAMTQRAAGSQDLGEVATGIVVATGDRADEPQAPRPAEPRPPYLVQSAPVAAQSRPASDPAGDPGIALSRREMAILRTLTEGASNKIIARKLVITESTVKVHMKAILRKLRLQNRTQAAIWARTHLGELAA